MTRQKKNSVKFLNPFLCWSLSKFLVNCRCFGLEAYDSIVNAYGNRLTSLFGCDFDESSCPVGWRFEIDKNVQENASVNECFKHVTKTKKF